MRRIFPALLTVLFICIGASSNLLDPAEMVGFGKSLLATTFFLSDFYFWHSAEPAGYFDTINIPVAPYVVTVCRGAVLSSLSTDAVLTFSMGPVSIEQVLFLRS